MSLHSQTRQICWLYMVLSQICLSQITFWNTTENQEQSSFVPYIPSDEIYPDDANLTYVFNETKSRRMLALEVTDFVCGTYGFCNKSLSRGKYLCTFYCKPCRCDERCHLYGDCCPDVALDDSHIVSTASEDFLICPTETWTTWNNMSHIFMVGVCPPNSDPDATTKCQHPDSNIIDQATPVSHSTLVFRNMYCAMCYGLLEYDTWSHDVVCRLGSSIQLATSKADLWRRSVEDRMCNINTKPTTPVFINECYPLKYSTCNATGRALETPPEEMEELCAHYNHPVDYYGSSGEKKLYKNIFCAMCDGAILNTNTPCSRKQDPDFPFPLTTLLNFNPQAQSDITRTECEVGRTFDPITKSCRIISCSLRRELVGNSCEEIFSEASGLGIRFTTIVKPIEPTHKIQAGHFKEQYLEHLNASLQAFQPLLVTMGNFDFLTDDPKRSTEGPADLGMVEISIVSITTKSLLELERNLTDFITTDFIYQNLDGSNTSLNSMPYLCPTRYEIPSNHSTIRQMEDSTLHKLDELDPRCKVRPDCNVNIKYEPIPLACPFIEYNITEDGLSLDVDKVLMLFDDQGIGLSVNTFIKCGDILKVCVDDLADLNTISKKLTTPENDYVLSIVSLVCMSLSLTGLLLTFLTYCFIPSLRTLPGQNTMALVLNLFLAQLLFLTTSNRTSSIVLCQIFGVLTHFFWLSSYAWMSISAYHMFTVFTRFKAVTRDPMDDKKIFLRYTATCFLLPSCVVGACLMLYLVRSRGVESGYGGNVCFLNNPLAIGVFFAAPLVLMLILNTVFFGCTLRSICSTPDMKTSSNKQHNNHIFSYFKLSLLFGFTWTFGLLYESIKSPVLSYAFSILTGSQGLLIFMSYCLNKLTWNKLKKALGAMRKKMDKESATSKI